VGWPILEQKILCERINQ